MASRLVPSVCYFMLAVAFLAAGAVATDYKLHWIVPPTDHYYADWIKNTTIEVGDSVIFNWSTTHNVANVSKSEYDNCTKTSSATPRPVKIPFNSTGNHYFICTVGNHCDLGQKLAVTVHNRGNDTGSAAFVTVGFIYAALPISFVYFLSHYV